MSEPTNEQILADALRELKPGTPSVDQRELFYRAGFEACRSELKSKDCPSGLRSVAGWFPSVAASLATAIICIPLSYGFFARQHRSASDELAGKTNSLNQSEVAQISSTPNDQTLAGPSNDRSNLDALDERNLEPAFLSHGISTSGDVVVLPPESRGRTTWLRSWQDRQSGNATLTAFHSRLRLESSPANLLSDFERQTQLISETVNQPLVRATDVLSSSPFTARGVSASDMQQFTQSLEVTH